VGPRGGASVPSASLPWPSYMQAKGGKPAWPLGAAMGGLHLPVSLAEGACRLWG